MCGCQHILQILICDNNMGDTNMRNLLQKSGRLCLSLFLAGLLSINFALAGEVDGKGNPVPGGENGRSDCSYSGQQDNAEEDEGVFKGDRVQNWGQFLARGFLITIGFTPGRGTDACNPNKKSEE
jgi:hypothetical protein